MSDPYAAPDAPPAVVPEPPADGLADPHLLVARASLALAAAWGFLFAQAMVITGAIIPFVEPELRDVPGSEAIGVFAGLVAGAFVLAFTFVWLLGAVMLGRRTQGAWIAGLVGHAALVVTCSPVLGGHGLYALLKDGPPRGP